MHTQQYDLNIRILKQQLGDLISSKNYNLLDTEILFLSQQLDQLIIPLFEQQCETSKPQLLSFE